MQLNTLAVEINPDHIKEAQQIFIKGKIFDDERISFINKLNTIDLLAVPGSGKTTALLAKLYALSKNLPFDDGSGILVLSHTNAAINEIESKLKKHCPKLFEYPNFIGTVQGFVNKFLANPANQVKYSSYLNIVDNDIANKKIVSKIKGLEFKNALRTYFFFQIYGQNTFISKKDLVVNYNLTEEKANEYVKALKTEKILTKNGFAYDKIKSAECFVKLNIDESLKIIVKDIYRKAKEKVNLEKDDRGALYRLDFINNKFLFLNASLGFESSSGKELIAIYESLLGDGIARFVDCYSLAFWYIENYPNVLQLLQNRFKFVFIDEMQDLEGYQIELIDSIFAKGELNTVIQRIGDINQSIYNSVKIDCDWKTRNENYLNGSNRLTKSVAELVNCFTLDTKEGKFIVEGKNTLLGADIAPHLILFSEGSKMKLKESFIELIEKYNLVKTEEAKNGFKIVGWIGNRENEGDGKHSLFSMFGFSKENKSNKEDYDTLCKYLQLFDKEKETLEAARKSILNALISILRIEGKKIKKSIKGRTVERYYSKSDFVDFVKDYNNEVEYLKTYEEFKQKLFNWSFELAVLKGNEKVYSEIINFIHKDLKEWFDLSLNSNQIKTFIGAEFIHIKSNINLSEINSSTSDRINIEIATVHSVKGQTHCATLYVETAHKSPVYETLKLKEENKTKTKKQKAEKTNPLFKQLHSCTGQYAIQALKMMYVGFSRPTHLLCFAVLKDNVINELEEFKRAGWIINDITEISTLRLVK
jgi:DNA helicase-2/ATP-dependent DNA helicase PcrA